MAAFRLFVEKDASGEFSQSSLHKSWQLACEEAEVPFFTPYRLRHTYATALRAGGMDLADMQQLLGHTSSRTIERYAAVSADKLTGIVIKRQAPVGTNVAKPLIQGATAVPLDDTTSLVEVRLGQPRDQVSPEQVLVIGGKVFGYADAPIVRDAQSFTAVVPSALIRANPSVQVTALFAPFDYRDSRTIEGITTRSRAERLVLLEEGGGQTKFLLYGSRLSGATVLVPSSADGNGRGRCSS